MRDAGVAVLSVMPGPAASEGDPGISISFVVAP
jgi:hypothetical protein